MLPVLDILLEYCCDINAFFDGTNHLLKILNLSIHKHTNKHCYKLAHKLIDFGIDVKSDTNIILGYCQSGIHLYNDIIVKLIDGGADLDCINENGETPLMLYCANNCFVSKDTDLLIKFIMSSDVLAISNSNKIAFDYFKENSSNRYIKLHPDVLNIFDGSNRHNVKSAKKV